MARYDVNYFHYYDRSVGGINWSDEPFDKLFGSGEEEKSKFFNKDRKNFTLSKVLEGDIYQCVIDYNIITGNSLLIAIFTDDLDIINVFYGCLFHDIMETGDIINVVYFYEIDQLVGGIYEIKTSKKRPLELLNRLKKFPIERVNIDLYKIYAYKREELTKSDKIMEKNYPYGLCNKSEN